MSQTPFSSVNYGTDTSEEGRMVVRNLLEATIAGLGDGETPIFPIQIFKVKKGVNLDKEDPNYDLFKLAMKTSAKRLFPNFSFIDAPYNLQYYKEGDHNTEVAYMGCVQGEEIITYKIDEELYVEGISRAYVRISEKYPENIKKYGISNYVDTEGTGVKVYDTNKKGFVNCKKIIQNPNKDNWLRLKASNGRTLVMTEDHPLPIVGRGRVFAKDMVEGDEIYVTYEQYSEESVEVEVDKAYLLGMLLCDSSYQNNIVASLGDDEDDIVDRVENIVESLGYTTSVKRQERGKKGVYKDINIKCGVDLKPNREKLEEIFGGLNKCDRQIPNFIFRANREAKMSFLAGMIDADGYMNHHRDRVESGCSTASMVLGSVNKELALQQMALIQTLGYPCKVYLNNYKKGSEKVRYLLHFGFDEEILGYMSSKKKVELSLEQGIDSTKMIISDVAKITSIESYNLGEESYDLETESDMFDVSGIISHNCRTRVMANVHDPDSEIATGRGNLSFTSINLPRLALENRGKSIEEFYKELEGKLDLTIRQLDKRFKLQSSKKVKNFPFLMGQNVWIDTEGMGPEDTIGEVLKHGTLSVGFIGLAETLKVLTGKHHGEDSESQKLGLEIIGFMREYLDKLSEERKLNYSLIATPKHTWALV